MGAGGRATLLVVDDDRDDQELFQEALAEIGFGGETRFVDDGDVLLDYLHGRGKFEGDAPRPRLIVLDLHMPRMRGFDALEQINLDPNLRTIPVVVMTTSWSEQDIARAYELGVNSFLIKPVLFDELITTVRTLVTYWLELNEPPPLS